MTLSSFSEESSIHGIKYAFGKKNSVYDRAVWFCLMVAGFSCVSVFVIFTIWNWHDNPTITSIQSVFAPIKG